MDRNIGFGEDNGLHFSKFQYTVIANGLVYKNVTQQQIEDGLTGDLDVDRAILRTNTYYIDQRCWTLGGNGRVEDYRTTLQHDHYGIPVTLTITKDCNTEM